jgi:hypothetical protein
LPQTFDCGADLDVCATEVEAALALCGRIGFDFGTASFLPYRQVIRALRGETAAPGSFTDNTFDEDAHLAELSGNASAAVNFHLIRALAAAVFGDTAALVRHSTATGPMLPAITATYGNVPGHTLICLASALRARGAEGEERAAALAELDRSRDFLAARAADQPGNFRHLHHFVEAERAWTISDFSAAATAFDAAVCDAVGSGRPWHAALITERAGLFFLAHGLEHVGRQLLADALRG